MPKLAVYSVSVVFFTTFGLFDLAGALARGVEARHQLTRLTIWTYWLSVLAASFPHWLRRSWVSVILSLNIHVTAAYWTLRAESAGGTVEWSPRDFVVHGGLLGLFMRALQIGMIKPPGSPSSSALIVASLLLLNYFAQLRYDDRQDDDEDTPLTECTAWKIIVVPATGAAVAAGCGGWRAW